jgi:hypothetical protein
LKTETCQACGSRRLAGISAKCSDYCMVDIDGEKRIGSLPPELQLGSESDYIDFTFCLECGRIQGEFPIRFEQSRF